MPLTISGGLVTLANAANYALNYGNYPSYTISHWIRVDRNDGGAAAVTFGPRSQPWSPVLQTAGNAIQAQINDNANFNFTLQYPYQLGLPVHVVMVYSPSGQYIYFNGMQHVNPAPFGDVPRGDVLTQYGGIGNVATSTTQVTIQDWALHTNYAATPDDVMQLFTRSKTPAQIGNGPLLWYTYDGPAGFSIIGPNNTVVNAQGLCNSGNLDPNWNLTSFVNVAPGAVAYYTDSDLQYVSPITIGNAYISSTSGLVVFVINEQNNGPLVYNLNLSENPSVNMTLNGVTSPVTLGSPVTDPALPLVIYPVANLPEGATYTFSAPLNWITTSVGNAALQTGYLSHYGGRMDLEFPPPSAYTMLWGFNVDAIGDAYWGATTVFRNYAKKGMNFWSEAFGGNNISEYQLDKYPNRFNTTPALSTFYITQPTHVDAYSLPGRTGVWNITYTDDPVYSSIISINTQISPNYSSKIVGFSSSVLSGVRYTSVQQEMSIINMSGDFGPYFRIQVDCFDPTNVNFANLFIAPSYERCDGSDPAAASQDMLDWCSTTGGKFVPVLRFDDWYASYGGQSNAVEPEDLVPPTAAVWNRPGFSANVTGIRPYTAYPNSGVYFNQDGWLYASSNQAIFPVGNPNSRYCYELLFDSAHSFRTGQWVTTQATNLASIQVTGDGQIFTVSPPFGGSYGSYVYVTGPSSIVQIQYGGNFTGPSLKTIVDTFDTRTDSLKFAIQCDVDQLGGLYDTYLKICGSLSGCIPWVNVPHAASDRLVSKIAQLVLQYIPSGTPSLWEYTNEHWNYGFQQWYYLIALQALKYGPAMYGGADYAYTVRANEVHNVADAVLTSGGRPHHVIRNFSGQYGNDCLGNILSVAAARKIPVDVVSFAPYVNIQQTSPFANFFNNSTIAQMHDLWRHWLEYNSNDAYVFSLAQANIHNYNVAMGTGIKLGFYEGGIQTPVLLQSPIVGHDWFYHEQSYNSRLHFMEWGQRKGGSIGAYFTLQYGLQQLYSSWPLLMWSTVNWQGQREGAGSTNVMAATDGRDHSRENSSPALLAFKHFTDKNINLRSYDVYPVANTGTNPLQLVFNKAVVPSTVSITLMDSNKNVVPTKVNSDGYSATVTPIVALNPIVSYMLTVSGVRDTVGIKQQNVLTFPINAVAPVTSVSGYTIQVGNVTIQVNL